MKKLIKKFSIILILAFSCTFISYPSVFANEKETTITLVGENYSNSSLVREYRDKDNNEYLTSFLIPEHLSANVEKSQNKIREAKKVLFLYYTFKEEEAILKQLKNEVYHSDGYNLAVSEEYSSLFHSDLATIVEFTENNSKFTTVKEKYLSDISDELFSDYEKGWVEEPNKKDSKDSSIKPTKEISLDSKPFNKFYVVIPLLLALSGGIVFYILSRR